eukprot:s204_g36.t1
MASFNVTGTVHMKDGRAQLSLAPVEEEVKITMTRPTTDDILNKVGNGVYTLHGSRVPLLRQHVSNMMNTIQRQLLLKTGQDGAWTEEAQQRLIALLTKPKVPVKNTPLPLEDKKPSSSSSSSSSRASKKKALLAIKDKKSSSSSSSSSSRASKKKALLAIKDKKSTSSSSSSASSSSDSECVKERDSQITRELDIANTELEAKTKENQKLKDDFDGMFSALHHTIQDLEKKNEEIQCHKETIAELRSENLFLRQQLQAYETDKADDVSMVDDAEEPTTKRKASDDTSSSDSESSSEYMTSDHSNE